MSDLVVLAACALGIAVSLGAAWLGCYEFFPRLEAVAARRYGIRFSDSDSHVGAVFTREAEARARSLLLSKLTPAQRRSWHLRRRFDVRAQSGTVYTISSYRPYNIKTHDAIFCLQVHGATPALDKLLAQKLLVECDERLFLARANVRTQSRARRETIEAARAHYALGE